MVPCRPIFHRGSAPGYDFDRGDDVRLKMLAFLVHKDAVLLARAER